MPGTSGRIAASQAAKQTKTCDPSYPSLDLVRELPRARGVGESELTRTRERPRQAVEGVSLRRSFQSSWAARRRRIWHHLAETRTQVSENYCRGSRGCYIVIHTPFKPLAFSAPHYSGDVDAQCLPQPRAVRDTGQGVVAGPQGCQLTSSTCDAWLVYGSPFFILDPGFFIWFCWHPIRSYMNTLIKNYIFHTLWTPLIKTTKYISKVF